MIVREQRKYGKRVLTYVHTIGCAVLAIDLSERAGTFEIQVKDWNELPLVKDSIK